MKILYLINRWYEPKIIMVQKWSLQQPLDEFCPFRPTRCLWQYRKSCKSSKGFPEIPFKHSFRSKPSCHTLSKASGTSNKILLSSISPSNNYKFSWVIRTDWLIQKSSGLNPNWRNQVILIKKNQTFIMNEMLKNFAAY